MVKIFKKGQKEETFASGRIIVTPFSKLKKEDFPQRVKVSVCKAGVLFFLNYDGKIYIDSTESANEAVIRVLKILVQYPKTELQKWEKEQKMRFSDIKTVEDLEKLSGDSDGFFKALSMFLVPFEIKSRETQRDYYGII